MKIYEPEAETASAGEGFQNMAGAVIRTTRISRTFTIVKNATSITVSKVWQDESNKDDKSYESSAQAASTESSAALSASITSTTAPETNSTKGYSSSAAAQPSTVQNTAMTTSGTENAQNSAVATGDDSHMEIMGLIMAANAVVITAYLIQRRRNRGKQ